MDKRKKRVQRALSRRVKTRIPVEKSLMPIFLSLCMQKSKWMKEIVEEDQVLQDWEEEDR